MVNGLNAVEIAVGGVSGAAFGSIFDGITGVLRNAAEFTTSHTNIKSTLAALQPLIQEIEGKNNTLLLQDEELKDLKNEIEAGVKRVQELSKRSVWNYCMRPLYNMELEGMDKSLNRLLQILQVQGVRDVKEVLVQVNDCKTDVNKISIQVDDCKTEIVEKISGWKGKATDQLDQVASNVEKTLNLTKRMLDQFERITGSSVTISEKVAPLVEVGALGSSLRTMRPAVDEALSKPNPHYDIFFRIEEALRRVVEQLGDADENRKLEEGTELIRKCSNVVEWNDRKTVKYANKLNNFVKFLEAFGQRLKRTKRTMPKGFDTLDCGHHDSSVFSYSSILAATSNFAEENKLGEGGYGPVYKGKLAMGQEIAVKRRSKSSGQGALECKNELILNELHHTNLVQLFGFCIHGEEMMLIYEYLPNRSLDHFLFDPTRGLLLDWKKRFSILEGIAQGLLYLHKYSRKKVIHRDIKPSNILLDENMNPKISDFGTAMIFTQNELEANMNPKISDFGTESIFPQNELEAITSRILGTLGYMPPESLREGIISVKSDVYAFGVLMLEMISGRKNRFCNDRRLSLVGYARALWNEGAGLELMDPTLGNSFIKEQLLRCIHVGLLCVEENAADRPTVSDVICMLINESLPLASPTKPAFYVGRSTWETTTVETGTNQQLETVASANYMSCSDFEAR